MLVVVVALNGVGIGGVRGGAGFASALRALVPLVGVGRRVDLRVRLTVRRLGLVLAELQGRLPSSVLPVAVLVLLLALRLATPAAPAPASAASPVALHCVVLAFRCPLQAVLRLRPARFFTLLPRGTVFVTLFGVASRSRRLTLRWLVFLVLVGSFRRIGVPVWFGSTGSFSRAVRMGVMVRIGPGRSSARLGWDVLCVD